MTCLIYEVKRNWYFFFTFKKKKKLSFHPVKSTSIKVGHYIPAKYKEKERHFFTTSETFQGSQSIPGHESESQRYLSSWQGPQARAKDTSPLESERRRDIRRRERQRDKPLGERATEKGREDRFECERKRERLVYGFSYSINPHKISQ